LIIFKRAKQQTNKQKKKKKKIDRIEKIIDVNDLIEMIDCGCDGLIKLTDGLTESIYRGK
jgi:hypothetical protein